jgi:hypothetical protein
MFAVLTAVFVSAVAAIGEHSCRSRKQTPERATRIKYIIDREHGICFAMYQATWEERGGVGLVEIDCEKLK